MKRVLLYPSNRARVAKMGRAEFEGVVVVHPLAYAAAADAYRAEGFTVAYVHETPGAMQ